MGWAKAHELSKLLTILSKLLTGFKGVLKLSLQNSAYFDLALFCQLITFNKSIKYSIKWMTQLLLHLLHLLNLLQHLHLHQNLEKVVLKQ
jgi:hypothetical protein